MPRRGGGGHGGGGRRAPTCREQSCRGVPGGRGSASSPPPLDAQHPLGLAGTARGELVAEL